MLKRSLVNSGVLITADLFFTSAALYLSHLERMWLDRFSLFNPFDDEPLRYMFSGLLYLLLFALFYFRGLYHKRNDFWEETRIILQSVLFLFILIAAYTFLTKTSEQYSRTMITLLFLNLVWLMPLGRAVAKKLLDRLGMWRINAFIDGNETQAEAIRHDLAVNWFLGYRDTVRLEDADIVLLATKEMPVDRLEERITYYKRRVPEVMLVPYLHNISFANAEIIDLRIGRMSLINIQNQLFVRKNRWIKKVSEFVVLLLMLPAAAVVMAVIAVLIKIDSPGPVFFRQQRLGMDAEPFECIKFRTMFEDNAQRLEAYLKAHPEEVAQYQKYHKYHNDPRVTRVGYWLRRLSIDELPQIINVFRFEMNLIGPRPYMLHEREKIGDSLETIVHVRPGLTGLWQISGRNELTFAERVELDVWYIQNWSPWMDFIIFVKTFEVLLTRRGAR